MKEVAYVIIPKSLEASKRIAERLNFLGFRDRSGREVFFDGTADTYWIGYEVYDENRVSRGSLNSVKGKDVVLQFDDLMDAEFMYKIKRELA